MIGELLHYTDAEFHDLVGLMVLREGQERGLGVEYELKGIVGHFLALGAEEPRAVSNFRDKYT